MKDFLARYSDFKGIELSLANPDAVAFKDLTNLRSDAVVGGLVPRFGVRHLFGFTPNMYSVDGFVYNQFKDIDSIIVVGTDNDGNQGIFAYPGFIGDAQSTDTVNITGTYQTTVVTCSGTSLTVTSLGTGNWSTDQGFLYTIVRNVSQQVNEYAVVTAVSGTTFTLSRSITWTTNDIIVFFRSELQASVDQDATNPSWGTGLQLNYTVLSVAQLVSMSGTNDVGIYGLADDISNSNLWVGEIPTRKYFGSSGFTFNGLYGTALFDDFSYGAFQRSKHHIQVKVVSSATTNQRLDPNQDVSVNNFAPTPLWQQLDDGDTPNDGDFVSRNFVDLSGKSYFEIGFTNPTGDIDFSGDVLFNIRVKCSTNDGQLTTGLYNGTTPLNGVGAHAFNMTSTFTTQTFLVKASLITNFNNLVMRVAFSNVSLAGVVYCSWISAYVPQTSYINIKPTQNTTYVLSFSLMEDGFNETKLIYDKNYGMTQTEPASYSDANNLIISSGDSKIIVVRIGTKFAELVNRRNTELRIYGAVVAQNIASIEAKDLLWRLCRRVSLSDDAWKYSSGEYYAEINVGDEINTGEIYDDRTTYSPSDDLKKKAYYATFSNQRVFVRNNTDKTTVYFSPNNTNGFSTSVEPSSNFFIMSKTQEEIRGLSSVNNKLIVWKKFSIWSVDISGLPDTPRDDYITIEKGLSSLQSIALANRVIYFNSYDGIYLTDGFKISDVLNLAWREEYLTYTEAEKESAIGYYDTYSDSYVLYISGKVWVLDTKTGYWRNERWFHRNDFDQTLGIPTYVAKAFDGRTTLYAGAESIFYQYPRSDGGYFDSFTDESGPYSINQVCSWETTEQRTENGLDEAAYSNNAYVDGDEFDTGLVVPITLSIKNGSTVLKSNTITSDRQIVPLTSRSPFSRYSIAGSFQVNGRIAIFEFGVYMKSAKRGGSVLTQ